MPATQPGQDHVGAFQCYQEECVCCHPGPWTSNNAPAFRWAIRFTTEERSPNLAQGRLSSVLNIPPAVRCDLGRFATMELKLRTQTQARPELNSESYTATPDGLMLMTQGMTYVFRRR